VRITFDPAVDAAYVYLEDSIAAGGVARTYPVPPSEIKWMINFDFDHDGRMIGIEALDASRSLPPELLRAAEKASPPVSVQWDRTTDVAYLTLGQADIAATTYRCDRAGAGFDLRLDFNIDHRLVGIRISEASRRLTKKLL
jgi:uncharacterized protein YuzE